MVRFLNVALLVGLGASLAVSVPRLWSQAVPEKAPDVVEPNAVAPHPPLSCYERVRLTNPDLAGGPFKLRLNIGISGRVKLVSLAQPDRELQPLLPCLREEVGQWSFPRQDEEYSVEIRVSPPIWR
jgi:hypothetical protein